MNYPLELVEAYHFGVFSFRIKGVVDQNIS